MSIAVPFASDAKSVTLLQFNERNSKAVAGVFDGVYEWWGASCTAHLQLAKAPLS